MIFPPHHNISSLCSELKPFALSLSLSLSGGCSATELSFLLEPSDVIAVRDKQLLLDCQVQGEGPIVITWRRNGAPVEASQRVQVLANGTLLIQSFQKRRERSDGDVGEYDCAARNRYGMLVSRKARVQLACKCTCIIDKTQCIVLRGII